MKYQLTNRGEGFGPCPRVNRVEIHQLPDATKLRDEVDAQLSVLASIGFAATAFLPFRQTGIDADVGFCPLLPMECEESVNMPSLALDLPYRTASVSPPEETTTPTTIVQTGGDVSDADRNSAFSTAVVSCKPSLKRDWTIKPLKTGRGIFDDIIYLASAGSPGALKEPLKDEENMFIRTINLMREYLDLRQRGAPAPSDNLMRWIVGTYSHLPRVMKPISYETSDVSNVLDHLCETFLVIFEKRLETIEDLRKRFHRFCEIQSDPSTIDWTILDGSDEVFAELMSFVFRDGFIKEHLVGPLFRQRFTQLLDPDYTLPPGYQLLIKAKHKCDFFRPSAIPDQTVPRAIFEAFPCLPRGDVDKLNLSSILEETMSGAGTFTPRMAFLLVELFHPLFNKAVDEGISVPEKSFAVNDDSDIAGTQEGVVKATLGIEPLRHVPFTGENNTNQESVDRPRSIVMPNSPLSAPIRSDGALPPSGSSAIGSPRKSGAWSANIETSSNVSKPTAWSTPGGGAIHPKAWSKATLSTITNADPNFSVLRIEGD